MSVHDTSTRHAVPPVVRDAVAADGERLASIYNQYIRETTVTFEENDVTAGEMAQRVADQQGAGLPWLVLDVDGVVRAYAYASPWRARSAYRFSVEITVYLEDGLSGRGLGSALYTVLFERLRARGVHAVIGGIALPNDASIRIHEKFGMRKVAHFEQVGFKHGRWGDVAFWERILS